MEPEFIELPSKPGAPVAYNFIAGRSSLPARSPELLVFVNGLGLPARSWTPAIKLLQAKLDQSQRHHPSILTFDRFGQGQTTARDPLDQRSGIDDPAYGHTLQDAAADLHEVMASVLAQKHGIGREALDAGDVRLIMVGASIGVPIARLWAQEHPRLLETALFLDSNMAHINFSEVWPDPTDAQFDAKNLLDDDDCDLPKYIAARNRLAAMFDLDVKNPEGLDRRNGPILLPRADAPPLISPDGTGPTLVVVGHDQDTFAEMSLKLTGTPKSLTRKLTQPCWAAYNESLTKLSAGKCEKVVIAKGCGHFIQADDPEFVAETILKLL